MKFYFYGAVTYPVLNPNDIPRGSIGLHSIDGEVEDENKLKKECEDRHNKQNIYLVDMFGKATKVQFKWYGEYKK